MHIGLRINDYSALAEYGKGFVQVCSLPWPRFISGPWGAQASPGTTTENPVAGKGPAGSGKPRTAQASPGIAHAWPHLGMAPALSRHGPGMAPAWAQAWPRLSLGTLAQGRPWLGQGRQGVGGLRRIDFGGRGGLDPPSTPQECTGYFLQIYNKKIILLMKEEIMDEFMKYVPLAVLALLVVHMLLF